MDPEASFHMRNQMIPHGFMSLREYYNVDIPGFRSIYLCETFMAGESRSDIRYRVTMLTRGGKAVRVFEGRSPTKVWTQIVRLRIKRIRLVGSPWSIAAIKDPIKSVDGRGMFGLSHPNVQSLLEGTIGALRCDGYKYLYSRNSKILSHGDKSKEPQGKSEDIHIVLREGVDAQLMHARENKGGHKPKNHKPKSKATSLLHKRRLAESGVKVKVKIPRASKEQRQKKMQVSSESALDNMAEGLEDGSFVHAMFGDFDTTGAKSVAIANPSSKTVQEWAGESVDWFEGDFAIEARAES